MTSTTRSTAGIGFDFEDQVAAWVMLSMLHGEPLWGLPVSGTRLQMQVKALGWKVDDILLTSVADDQERRRAISCKSNEQVTAEKFPPEFVASCWRQWFQSEPNPLQKGSDGFVLGTRGRNNDFMATWTEIKSYSKGSDSKLALGRMLETNKFQTMFSSVKAPAKDAGFDVSDDDVLALIRSISVQPFDLQVAGSEAETLAITKSRLLLLAGSHEDGQELWRDLIDAARDTRMGCGTLELTELLARLRGKHSLRDHPDYSKSWLHLRVFSNETRDRIETELSSGTPIDRAGEISALLEKLSGATVTVVYGDSGSGKSALLKTAIASSRPGIEQIWLDPSSIDLLLNQVTRTQAGVEHSLVDVLRRPAADLVLVIDAAERISPDISGKTKALVSSLAAAAEMTECKIVIVGQTDAWADGRLQELAGSSPSSYEVEALSTVTVRRVLTSTPGLGSLALDPGALHALTNIRTLSWVVQAAARFQLVAGSSKLSLVDIADRLWSYWTDSKVALQGLLMRLAEREGNFEHSFAISDLDSAEAGAFDMRPVQCPLRRDASTGRIRFAHDLASEWARFQKLRQLSDDMSKWQGYAGNPFWHGPIRMLGQHFSRIMIGERSGWEVAYEAAEANRESAPLADDLLLDALFLDPEAETFLEKQVERLFADDGRRLLRLIKRFEHVATEPHGQPRTGARIAELSLYIDAEFRAPIYGRWPPMARFLSRNQARVAALLSSEVSRLCDRWLTGTPLTFGAGQSVPFRFEFASLALACARELQIAMAKRDVWGLHDAAKPIFQAALAAGRDLPKEVGAWALEMSGRRPQHADVVQRVTEFRVQRVEEHQRRMQTDEAYRGQQERLRALPTHLSSGSKLPPWPLGPSHELERSFREAALGSGALSSLMRSEPELAAEILLACVVEDDPEEEYSRPTDIDDELGIAYSDDSYPTAPWKSPFLLFLSINSDVAISTLVQLVNFATDRWVRAIERWERESPTPVLALKLADGSRREYAGYGGVFNWSHDNSNFIGQLHSALAALEQWICDRRGSEPALPDTLDLLLRTSHSSAIVGVLTNLAKYKPDLLNGPLRCLAGSKHVYMWDFGRVEQDRYSAGVASLFRGGELMFEMGKQWLSRPYRRIYFKDLVGDLVASDTALGAYVLEETAKWVAPDEKKAALEFELLRARLDHRNYQLQTDPQTGATSAVLRYPPNLIAAVQAFDSENFTARQVLTLPGYCDERLKNPNALQPVEAALVASLLDSIDADSTLDLQPEMKAPARLGAACLLALRGIDWLAQNSAIKEAVERLILGSVDAAASAAPDDAPARMGSLSPLRFAAWVAIERWVQDLSVASERFVLKVLVSDDEAAVTALFAVALRHRTTLAHRWWRLNYLLLLWSGLLILKPRYGDTDAYSKCWQRWRRWLTTRSLSTHADLHSIKPILVAQAVGRLEYSHSRRRKDFEWRGEVPRPVAPNHGGLRDDVLRAGFAWLVGGTPPPESSVSSSEQIALLEEFWGQQSWWMSGSHRRNGVFQLQHQFGYELVARLALFAQRVPADESARLWRPLFRLGPQAHHAISHFLGNWFPLLSESISETDWGKRWELLAQFVVDDVGWKSAEPWFHRESLTRHALGFRNADAIACAPGHANVVTAMKDFHRRWAKEELVGAEENLSEFCYFLASEAGKPLRIDALGWIAAAKLAKPELGSWYRQPTSGNFIDFLNMLVAEHSEELRAQPSTKSALLDLATLAAAKQIKASLQLLERIRLI